MIAYIVCEGPADAHLLKVVLPEELLNNVEVVSAGGVSATKSLARSLLVRRQVPIAIVVDADSVTPDLVQERRQSIKEIAESIAGNLPVKVILAIPEMEIIFFQDTSLLTRLLGYNLPNDIITLENLQPRQALEQLISQSKIIRNQLDIINLLSKEDARILQNSPVIRELIQFLQSVCKTVDVS
jgi:hypothetical protein